MPRLTPANVAIAHDIIGRYPRSKSALIPLLHLAQEQDGWVSEEAMSHIAELLGLAAAEVLGTASFYEMFKREPVGRYVVNVCTNISCQLLGGEELLEHAEHTLGVRPGSTTPDGLFTLEDVECIAACTEAPCLQVNYRYFYNVTAGDFDRIVAELRAGRPVTAATGDTVPQHGVLAMVRQRVAADRWVGRGGEGLPELPGRRSPIPVSSAPGPRRPSEGGQA